MVKYCIELVVILIDVLKFSSLSLKSQVSKFDIIQFGEVWLKGHFKNRYMVKKSHLDNGLDLRINFV